MRLIPASLLCFGMLALGACTTIAAAPAGPLMVGRTQVTLERTWSDVSAIVPGKTAKVKVLTLDGPALNRVYVTDGLLPGDTMLKAVSKESPMPALRAGMNATERMEFVADSVTAMGYQRVETARPRSAQLAGQPAVRFDLAARTSDGLMISGAAVAAEVAGKTYLVLYLAPAEHYFQATLPDVERLMNSALPGA